MGRPDEYHVKVAQTKEEIIILLEQGFEYVMERMVLPISGKGSSRIMDAIKTYGMTSHPLYFMNWNSSIFIFPALISFIILGVSAVMAFIMFSTVWHTSL